MSVIRAKAKEREGHNGQMLVDDLKQMQRVKAFEQVVKDVVSREMDYEKAHRAAQAKSEHNARALVNGHASDKTETTTRPGTVLTLFGNAPTPKQLFSSMQTAVSRQGSEIKAELPVEEISLPAGLATTKITPVPVDDASKGPTFEEAFPPPYNLTALQPPKSHRRSTTRDETIKWEFKDPLTSRSKKGGYTTQSLTVGEWLGYGGVDSKDEPSSPREKRKLRDRVLSSGEAGQPALNWTSTEDALAKEEEALFRRVYSSFAPSCDNSKAIVPEEVKSMIWWQKLGSKRFDETFALDPALQGDIAVPPLEAEVLVAESDEDFGQAVDEYEQVVEDDPLATEATKDKTDVDEVLKQVSELLETLASYQRIRNASLQTSSAVSRTPISPAPTLASKIGRPDSPAADEVSAYHALRREIAYLVLKLPPYALAKLNGDQLAELGVSKLMPYQNQNMKGTMEEDQVARLAKYTAQATAAGIATLTRSSSNSQHYSSANQRAPAIGQAANTRYGQSAQFGNSRTPLAQQSFNRPITTQSSYGTPMSTTSRAGYSQPNQYTRPGGLQAGVNGPNGQHYYQPQRTQSNTTYGQQYNQSTPQGSQRPSFSTSQPLAQYQQRAAQNAVSYQTNSQNAINRTASPIKPTVYQPPLQPSPIPRAQQQFQPPSQPGSGAGTPLSQTPRPQTPLNGGAMQSQSIAPRASSGTPQPLPPNGHA